MSKLYNQSKLEVNNFEQKESFDRGLSRYLLGNDALFAPQQPPPNVPIDSMGGVPLSGNGNSCGSVFCDPFDSHSLIIGSTGSKKSRLIAMPTVRILGSAYESMIICDPKAEIYGRTASYLKKIGYDIKVINLRNPDTSSCWNPLEIPYRFYKEKKYDEAYEFINDVVLNLGTDERQKSREPFWANSFQSFTMGLIALLFKYMVEEKDESESANVDILIELRKKMFGGNVLSDYSNVEEGVKKQLPFISKYLDDSFIQTKLSVVLNCASDTRRSILATFDAIMNIFTIKPSLTSMLSFNDIDFVGLITKPTAIFLVIPDEKTSFHGLVSLFVKQSYEYIIHLLQERNKKSAPVRLNYVLDEFSSLPAVNDFAAMITAARSRNIRFNIFIQSKNQLKLRYKEDTETIMSNCNNWIFLTSREVDLLNMISTLQGTVYDVRLPRPLLAIEDLQRLDKDMGETLILRIRSKPYVTMLPDISQYDNDDYGSPPITEVDNSTRIAKGVLV